MNAKKCFFAVVTILCLNRMSAQQVVDNICMQVIGSNGLSAEKLGKHYDATLGEVMTATLISADGSITATQGFHQPECAMGTVGAFNPHADWQLAIYPNPTASTLHIQYEHPGGNELEARVWNATGALIADWQALPPFSELDCSSYSAGLYLLEIQDPKKGEQHILRFVKTSF